MRCERNAQQHRNAHNKAKTFFYNAHSARGSQCIKCATAQKCAKWPQRTEGAVICKRAPKQCDTCDNYKTTLTTRQKYLRKIHIIPYKNSAAISDNRQDFAASSIRSKPICNKHQIDTICQIVCYYLSDGRSRLKVRAIGHVRVGEKVNKFAVLHLFMVLGDEQRERLSIEGRQCIMLVVITIAK